MLRPLVSIQRPRPCATIPVPRMSCGCVSAWCVRWIIDRAMALGHSHRLLRTTADASAHDGERQASLTRRPRLLQALLPLSPPSYTHTHTPHAMHRATQQPGSGRVDPNRSSSILKSCGPGSCWLLEPWRASSPEGKRCVYKRPCALIHRPALLIDTAIPSHAQTRRRKKIIGVGKNYALHIKEMGGQAPKAPVLFMKPTTSYVFEGQPIILDPKVTRAINTMHEKPPHPPLPIRPSVERARSGRPSTAVSIQRLNTPPQIGSVHHEVELAVVVEKRARKVPEGQAMEHVGGYALAIDLTARDLQAEAKKVGRGSGVCVWRASGWVSFFPVTIDDPILTSGPTTDRTGGPAVAGGQGPGLLLPHLPAHLQGQDPEPGRRGPLAQGASVGFV